MLIYKIELLELPKIRFAHTARMSDPSVLDSFYPVSTRKLEFAFTEEGEVHMHLEDGGIIEHKKGSIAALVCDQSYTLRSPSNYHEHISVQAVGNFQLTVVDEKEVIAFMRNNKSWKEDSPHVIFTLQNLPANYGLSRAEKLLRQVVYSYSDMDASCKMDCLGLLLRFYAEVSQITFRICLDQVGHGVTPSNMSYVQRAQQYIAANLHRPISVEEIANNLHISSHYVGSLFKTVTGQTLVEYINSLKIEKVKMYLSTQQMSLRQAGEAVGIHDTNYLGRLFKKHTGITIREFRLPFGATQAKEIDPDEIV